MISIVWESVWYVSWSIVNEFNFLQSCAMLVNVLFKRIEWMESKYSDPHLLLIFLFLKPESVQRAVWFWPDWWSMPYEATPLLSRNGCSGFFLLPDTGEIYFEIFPFFTNLKEWYKHPYIVFSWSWTCQVGNIGWYKAQQFYADLFSSFFLTIKGVGNRNLLPQMCGKESIKFGTYIE